MPFWLQCVSGILKVYIVPQGYNFINSLHGKNFKQLVHFINKNIYQNLRQNGLTFWIVGEIEFLLLHRYVLFSLPRHRQLIIVGSDVCSQPKCDIKIRPLLQRYYLYYIPLQSASK